MGKGATMKKRETSTQVRRRFNSRAMHPAKMGAVALAGLVAVALPAGSAGQEVPEPHSAVAVSSPMPPASPSGALTTSKAETTAPQNILRSHAINAFGEPKYGADFTHFEFVNPEAPQGGRFSAALNGSYDSLNQFVLRGVAATRLDLVYDTLMVRALDEPDSAYGLLAESVEMPEDRSWVSFRIRDEARWQDGEKVTAHDVVWTFETLTTEGHPSYRINYRDVTAVEALDDATVKFSLAEGTSRLLPLNLGDLPILPQHYWEGVERKFADSSNVMPMGSGPYMVDMYELGRRISYKRNQDWWANDLPVNRGRYNFNEVRYEYFLDDAARFEAFKSEQYNFFRENQALRWASAYNAPSMRDGRIVREEILHTEPTGMQGFIFNTRQEKFSDPKVRQALAQLFNFEWSNAVLASDAYIRTNSYFSNSELASRGLPEGRELEILEQFRGRIPDEIFSKAFELPVYEPRERAAITREMLRDSMRLMNEAGYELRGGKLTNTKTGRPLTFEFLLLSQGYERWILPYQASLEKLGVGVSIRVVDSSQYISRFRNFEYDVVVAVLWQNSTPGGEQRNYWHSSSADEFGSRNFSGIRDPVVDELVEMVVEADSREELAAVTKALDRVLLHGHYVIPHFHINTYRVAYSSNLDRPRQKLDARYTLGEVETWWHKQAGPKP